MTRVEFKKLAFDGGAWEYLDLEGDSVARLMIYALVKDAIKLETQAILKYATSDEFNRQHGERSPYAYELTNWIKAREQE